MLFGCATRKQARCLKDLQNSLLFLDTEYSSLEEYFCGSDNERGERLDDLLYLLQFYSTSVQISPSRPVRVDDVEPPEQTHSPGKLDKPDIFIQSPRERIESLLDALLGQDPSLLESKVEADNAVMADHSDFSLPKTYKEMCDIVRKHIDLSCRSYQLFRAVGESADLLRAISQLKLARQATAVSTFEPCETGMTPSFTCSEIRYLMVSRFTLCWKYT